MPTSQKNKAILFNPVGKDNITKSRIKQFWSENGAMNVQNLTDAAQVYAQIFKEFKPLAHRPFAVSVPIGRTQPRDVWRKFGNRFRTIPAVQHGEIEQDAECGTVRLEPLGID